jgi:hypothetical protein
MPSRRRRLSFTNRKMASPDSIAPVITADIRTASGDLGPDWSQKSSKSSRCLRWRIACEAGSDTAPARSGSSGRVGGGGLRGPSPGACRPPCRGRGPVRRWLEPAPGRPHDPAPRAGSRRRGLAAPGWRRPRLGRSRPATPGPACPPSRWLAPGRGGRFGPSAGLRPAAEDQRGHQPADATGLQPIGQRRGRPGGPPPTWRPGRLAEGGMEWWGAGRPRAVCRHVHGPSYRRCLASGTTTLFAELWLGKAHHALAIRRLVVAAGGLGSKFCQRMKIDGRPP